MSDIWPSQGYPWSYLLFSSAKERMRLTCEGDKLSEFFKVFRESITIQTPCWLSSHSQVLFIISQKYRIIQACYLLVERAHRFTSVLLILLPESTRIFSDLEQEGTSLCTGPFEIKKKKKKTVNIHINRELTILSALCTMWFQTIFIHLLY